MLNRVCQNASHLINKLHNFKMKKIVAYFVFTIMVSLTALNFAYAQPSGGDCWQSDDINMPGYCPPVPLDDHVIYIVIAAIGFGVYQIRKNKIIQAEA